MNPTQPPQLRQHFLLTRCPITSQSYTAQGSYRANPLLLLELPVNKPRVSVLSLNLAADGSPFTYSKAKSGPDAAFWLQAESEEFDRLFDSKTISPIHLVDQPQCRRRDTTYFNPQTTQKVNTMGKTTYRIRGTAGGDRINYSEPTSAQTAAMTVVKLLIHSVIIG